MVTTLRVFAVICLVVGLLFALVAGLFTEPYEHKIVSVTCWLFAGTVAFAILYMSSRNAARSK